MVGFAGQNGFIALGGRRTRRANPIAALFAALFAGGTPGVAYDFTDAALLFQDSGGTIPVTGASQPLGRALDLSGHGQHLTQTSAASRPLYQGGYTTGDFIDDWMTAPLTPGTYQMAYSTPLGFMVSGSGENGPTTRVPLGRVRGAVVRGTPFSDPERAALGAAWGVPEYTFVGYTTQSTVFHNISGSPVIRYVGANGVIFDQTANNVTTDLAAQGLTAPYAMLIPLSVRSNAALINFVYAGNQLTGSIPSLSANTALAILYCNNNQLTGSIPSLSANTALEYFHCNNNQLTGSIPDLSANTALVTLNCNNNQLTGSIPSLSANTALAILYCYNNQLTGWVGGTVSSTLGEFLAHNNQLPQATVDALLAAFDAAGRNSGTRILNLGGTGNAAPSAAGLISKANLQSKGWTVTTN